MNQGLRINVGPCLLRSGKLDYRAEFLLLHGEFSQPFHDMLTCYEICFLGISPR
jgi:hypothetical protein